MVGHRPLEPSSGGPRRRAGILAVVQITFLGPGRSLRRDARRQHPVRSLVQPRVLRFLVPVPGQRRHRSGADRPPDVPLRLAPPPRPLRPALPARPRRQGRDGAAAGVPASTTSRRSCEALGFHRFIESVDLEPFAAGPLTLTIHALVAPTDGPIGDSALLIDDGEVRVLNMNDSRPPEPDRLLEGGPLDAAFLQFSGAIWYPMVYDYPDNAQQVLGHKKRVAQLARAFRYIEVLDPAFVVPSAGPPCFLDDDLFEFNDLHGDEWNTFPDQPTFLEYIAERGRDGGRLMLPGSVADCGPRAVRRRPSGRARDDLRRQARLPRGLPGSQAAGHRGRAGGMGGTPGRPARRARRPGGIRSSSRRT